MKDRMLFPVLKKEWMGLGEVWERVVGKSGWWVVGGCGVEVEKCGKNSGFFPWRWLCVSPVTKRDFSLFYCLTCNLFFLFTWIAFRFSLSMFLYFSVCLLICFSPLPSNSLFPLLLCISLLSHPLLSSFLSYPRPPPFSLLIGSYLVRK